ncbi:MAG: hypothetical protein IPI32_14790 [Austwickia sp.]|nr:hypothetical protein [Austwickia sp.]
MASIPVANVCRSRCGPNLSTPALMQICRIVPQTPLALSGWTGSMTVQNTSSPWTLPPRPWST